MEVTITSDQWDTLKTIGDNVQLLKDSYTVFQAMALMLLVVGCVIVFLLAAQLMRKG